MTFVPYEDQKKPFLRERKMVYVRRANSEWESGNTILRPCPDVPKVAKGREEMQKALFLGKFVSERVVCKIPNLHTSSSWSGVFLGKPTNSRFNQVVCQKLDFVQLFLSVQAVSER